MVYEDDAAEQQLAEESSLLEHALPSLEPSSLPDREEEPSTQAKNIYNYVPKNSKMADIDAPDALRKHIEF